MGYKSIDTQPSNFVPEPPVKRLGGLALSIAIVPVSGYDTSPPLAILCKTSRLAGEYLCLPLHSFSDSVSYVKNGLPVLAGLQDGLLDVHFKRILIHLRTFGVFGSLSVPMEHRPAVILCLESQGSFREQMIITRQS